MDPAVTGHAGGIRQFRAVEAVGEDLVGHALAKPVGRGMGRVIDGLLPCGGFVVLTISIFSQPNGGAVRTGKGEVVPHQLRLTAGSKAAGKEGSAFLRGGESKGDLLPGVGKFSGDDQGAGGELFLGGGIECQGNGGTAGYGAVGLFAADVAGIKYGKVHIGKTPYG